MRKSQPPITSISILAQLSLTIVVAMVAPLLVGIWLSRTFALGPLAIVCAMTVGVCVGALVVYRIVKAAYEQLNENGGG